MNIAFAFAWMFNPIVGGTERVTDLLATELKQRGHNIHYIYTVKRDSDNDFECPADYIHFIDEGTLLSDAGKEVFHRCIKDNKIDVVINQGGVMGTCKKFADLPRSCKSVTVIHFEPMYGLDSLFMELSRLRDSSMIEKLKRIYRIFAYPKRKHELKNYLIDLYSYWGEKSDKVVLLSKRFEDSFLKLVPRFPIEKLTAIPNPVSFPIDRNIEDKEKMILWVGRMDSRQKQPDLMVKVWSKVYNRLPDWKLVMLGNGTMMERVKDMAKALDRIEFPGMQVSRPYFKRARISSSSEGWGMVLTEAASQGAVPIAFDSYASVRDIISDKAQLVTPYDISEYADKLANLAKDEVLQNKLREDGYKTAERYTVSSIVDKWENLLIELSV